MDGWMDIRDLNQDGAESEMRLSNHAFQMTEMCEIFGGRKLQVRACVTRRLRYIGMIIEKLI